jgi:YD repeat-containing protein
MKLSSLSFALFWAFKLHASGAYLAQLNDEAVSGTLRARQPKPVMDGVQRYFLPGTSGLLSLPKLKKLIGDTSIQAVKEELYFGEEDPAAVARAKAIMQHLMEVDEREGAFLELDLRSDWQREELLGRPSLRTDFYPGGMRKKSQVSYDALGRRTLELAFDQGGNAVFSRRYLYRGSGPTPVGISLGEMNGVTTLAVALTLNERGLPLEEEQADSQGLPLLHRSYRYDAQGRLTGFKETKGVKIRGLRFEWDYGADGRLAERRVISWAPLEPVWVTQFDWDPADGSLRERRELFDKLPLRENQPSGSGFDPRRALKYRWHYSDELGFLYWKPYDGPGNENFFDLQRRFKRNAAGWLTERETLDRDSMSLAREFWDWDKWGHLERHALWGKPGGDAETQRIDYQVDAKGNWIRKQAFGELEPVERKFEYFND